jgi:GTP-binding protein
VVVARGGRGGRGNASLASPKNRAPREAERGEPGEEHTVELEVRTIADAGLVGLPSAGKSTLLAAMTAARPKIAAYPFTTLSPNVGVAGGEGERFVLADVPGLIEGAHAGKGLGDRFLRHVMRCPVLVVVVDLTSENPVEDVRVVRDELASYDASLAERPYLIAATKCDLAPDGGAAAAGRLSEIGETLRVSGETGEGVEELLDRLGRLVVAAPRPGPEDRPAVVLRPGRPAFTVTEEAGRFRVSGTRVERWVSETDFDDPRSVAALQDRLAKEGVERKLAAAGARRGDEVMIGDRTFEYLPEED